MKKNNNNRLLQIDCICGFDFRLLTDGGDGLLFFDNGSSSSDSLSSFSPSSSPLLVSLIGFDEAAAVRLARGFGAALLFALYRAVGAFFFGYS